VKSDLDHLPERQQQELERIRSILLSEFEAARTSGAGGTSEWRKRGQVLKIILFGSYARTDWVDEPQNGYLSDFDLLIIVSHEKLTDIADYWWAAEDKILHDPAIGRTVNLIVHDLADVNSALSRGEYFWTDIVRDGVALYEVPGHALSTPRPMTSADALRSAERHLSTWTTQLDDLLKGAAFYQREGNRKLAAFSLHQAVEAAYACFLLVHTFYFPRSHNIKFLRSLAEDVNKRLIDAWPRESRMERRRFELLKRAYVEGRYSDRYDASPEDLLWLMGCAKRLREVVAQLCAVHINELRIKAQQS
jgi:predicted nucleotidyltransferase/HEPN domain-containing protein